MRRLLVLAVVAAGLTVPASATAVEFWGGPIGRNLPAADITYKVDKAGAAKSVLIEVRAKCSFAGGGKAPDFQLLTGFSEPNMTANGFKARRRNLFINGSQRIVATVRAKSAGGIFEAAFRFEDRKAGEVRVCRTGRLPWQAEPMSRKKWDRLRDYR